jgi:multiple sugar transport system permease protein
MTAFLKDIRRVFVRGSQDTQSQERDKALIGSPWYAPGTLVAMAFLLIIAFYFLLPLYYLIISMTKDNADLYGSNGLWFARNNLGVNLGDLFARQNGIFLTWLTNTFIYCAIGGAISMIISTMSGYALAKYHFVGRNVIFALVLGAVMVPATTLAIPIYLLESKTGIVGWGIAAFLLPNLLSPMGVYLARVYATVSVHDDLINAARVDGAGEFRTFLQIVIPILRPGMVTIFLFQFVAIWNNFFLSLVLIQDPNLWPVNLGLASWNFDPASHEDLARLIVTGSTISIIPLIVLFLFLQRYWRAGLTFGSVTSQ